MTRVGGEQTPTLDCLRASAFRTGKRGAAVPVLLAYTSSQPLK